MLGAILNLIFFLHIDTWIPLKPGGPPLEDGDFSSVSDHDTDSNIASVVATPSVARARSGAERARTPLNTATLSPMLVKIYPCG